MMHCINIYFSSCCLGISFHLGCRELDGVLPRKLQWDTERSCTSLFYSIHNHWRLNIDNVCDDGRLIFLQLFENGPLPTIQIIQIWHTISQKVGVCA